ncbi:MAG: protein phosphatase CheZ [candidate division Zixibacteria bacterium]|nr:protein phosphatase CheZ [candidate division Zixibacteria bacterium]MCK4605859.1 protein phosphatase CheZ [candidate division Zixibacteria bacterium]
MPNPDALHKKIQEEVSLLADSINDIVKKFRELNNPIDESKEQVPIATEQLDKISEQTEAATQRMLDKVEKIVEREEEGIAGLKRIKDYAAKNHWDEIAPLVDSLIEKADTTCADALSIMDALQFQDITAQQMNHAAALMEDIETKLKRISGVLQGDMSQIVSQEEEEAKKDRAYDPHADLFDKKTDQSAIDDMFAGKQ